jgi:ankyrin repeat protein
VSNSYFDVVKVLLELGANVNSKNSLGNTALHKAFMTRNMLIIHYLLQNDADLAQVNYYNQAPTYFATSTIINELGLQKYVTQYIGFDNFEDNFR